MGASAAGDAVHGADERVDGVHQHAESAQRGVSGGGAGDGAQLEEIRYGDDSLESASDGLFGAAS